MASIKHGNLEAVQNLCHRQSKGVARTNKHEVKLIDERPAFKFFVHSFRL